MSCAPAQWNRRREASARLVPLECGCRDLWTCRCEPNASPTAMVVDAWADTLVAILASGMVPGLPPPPVLRALWNRGGADRVLAEELHAGYAGRDDTR
jgi:hypothetical protein